MAKRRKRKRVGFDEAISAFRQQQYDRADAILHRLLTDEPPEARVAHLAGLAAYQLHRLDQAEQMLRLAVRLDPDSAAAHNDLGNLLAECDRPNEAMASYRRALDCDASYKQAQRNLALLLSEKGEAEAAIDLLDALIHDHTQDTALYVAKSKSLESIGRVEQAVETMEKAIAIDAPAAELYKRLVALYRRSGLSERIGRVVQFWLEDYPDDPLAVHLAAVHRQRDIQRASDAYVREVFDEFAQHFDHDLEALQYRGPQRIREVLSQCLGEPQARLSILDAGCGTGQCASVLRPYARRLVGVDLSPRMIEVAESHNVYDTLAVDELTRFLAAHQQAFDVIVAADTLNYFGELNPVFDAARTAVGSSPEGLLCFTVEEAREGQQAGYYLNANGRFTHQEAYLTDQLETAGWQVEQCRHDCLRQEAGQDVKCLIVAARPRRSGAVRNAV